MTILYQNTDDFHDITTGVSTGSPHYSAGPGYDYLTGLGTPVRRGRKLTSVRLTVIITPASGEDVTLPAGEVTLEMPMKSKKKVKVVTTLGSEPNSRGRLTLTLKASQVAQTSITIVYSGDANDDPSTLFVSRLI
jgi:Bacterial Ig-like domain (group 3)